MYFLDFSLDFSLDFWISADSVRDFLRDGPLGFDANILGSKQLFGKGTVGQVSGFNTPLLFKYEQLHSSAGAIPED